MAIVAVTLAIPELAKSNFDRCNSLLIVGSNGWMLNHDVNAAKKQNHEEWKLRMCGRAILHNANCLAFPKSSSSIFLEFIFLSILVQQDILAHEFLKTRISICRFQYIIVHRVKHICNCKWFCVFERK
jgi:hypothetical protein